MCTNINILIFESNARYRKKILEAIIRKRHLSKLPLNTLSIDDPDVVLQYIKSEPDFTVYLLDVAMEQRETGLFLANQIKQLCPKHPIVFLTECDINLLTNMKCKLLADTFIIKDSPLLYEELATLLQHFTNIFQPRFLQVKYDYEEILIDYDHIYYIEMIKSKMKAKIVCKYGEYEKGRPLNYMAGLDNRFRRVSKFYVINTDKIIKINRSTHIITLEGLHEIPYSTAYLKLIKNGQNFKMQFPKEKTYDV